jgi:hypothetical protein
MILNRNEKQIDEVRELYYIVDFLYVCLQNHWIHPDSSTEADGTLLYGINLVRNKADSSVRRGAVVKAMAIFSRYHFLEVCELQACYSYLHI